MGYRCNQITTSCCYLSRKWLFSASSLTTPSISSFSFFILWTSLALLTSYQ